MMILLNWLGECFDMRVYKRPKNSRIRGARTVGWGFRQKHKGHGNKGGFGKSGTGKRADHKKQVALESDARKKKRYFGKQGLTSKGTARDLRKRINLYDIKDNMFVKEGCKIDLSGYKILGSGDGFKAEIVALGASALAVEKMEKAGGRIVLMERKVDVKQYKKVEKK
jgi:large subunit ribosomal protein L15